MLQDHTQDGLSAHKDEPLISALLPKTRQPLGHCTPLKLRTPRPGGPGRRGFSNPLTPRPGGPGRRRRLGREAGRLGFSKLRTRGREAPIAVENPGRRGREAPAAVAFEPLVPSRRPGSGYPHSRYPFPPLHGTRLGRALAPSHRGVHRALTVEDDTGTSSQGPRLPRVAFRTPRPVEALRIRLRAQPVPVPPSLHGTRLSRACATQPRGLQFARDLAI